jgi:nucleoside-diphosphate-sugar epimerase
MKRVLITGANGFTGLHLIENLNKNGWEVLGTGRNIKVKSKNLYEADLTKLDEIIDLINHIKPTHIIHLAGLSFAAHPRPLELFQVNVFGTENLLKAVKSTGIQIEKIIIASSANIYGNNKEVTLDENTTPKPVNFYASSKLAMEHMAANWFDSLPIIITRPFNYTGPKQDVKFLIPKIISHFVSRSKTLTLGNINVSRDFSDVRTICDSYRLLCTVKQTGITVNLCNNTLTSLKEIISITEKITGHKLKIKVNPDFIRPNEIKKLQGCNKRLTELIGDINRPAIEETIDWMIREAKV